MKIALSRLTSKAGQLILFILLTGLSAGISEAKTVRQVKDINPGPGSSIPQFFGLYNGISFFNANDGSNGSELWKTDGSSAGTALFKDINPGPDGSGPRYLIVFDSRLFFAADDGTHGDELWVSDGTAGGITLFKDIDATAQPSFPSGLTVSGNLLYFSAQTPSEYTELWVTDGTVDGTHMVKDINASGSGINFFQAKDVNGTLFFIADDGVNGLELWKSDGAESNTVMVGQQDTSSSGSDPSYLVNLNGTLYFVASDGNSRNIYYTTGGTPSLLKSIVTGMSGCSPSGLVVIGNRIFFKASKATSSIAMGGCEPWVSDGTETGTFKIADVNPDPDTSSDPHSFTEFNGWVYFSADDTTHGRELWKTDGTLGSAVLVKDIVIDSGSSNPSNLVVHDGMLYFFATTADAGTEPWVSDGTADGTVRLADINPGSASGISESAYYPSGLHLFLRANDGTTGEELWQVTDSAPIVLKVNSVPETADQEISDQEEVTLLLTQLQIAFDQAVVNGDGSAPNDATNPANYLLVAAGDNGTFETATCSAGLAGDDVSITIDTVTYAGASRTATLSVNGGTALPVATYMVLVCGTTSIENLFGDKLDGNGDGIGGDDFIREFSVVADQDQDGVKDSLDNCVSIDNPDQADGDGDGVGNSCDNCVKSANADQADGDGDGIGDVCDNCPVDINSDQADDDWDGYGNTCDNCPLSLNSDQADTDSDGIGDSCDNCVDTTNSDQADGDGDGFGDSCDNCPTVVNKSQADFDGDNFGDLCDADDDNDDLPDTWEDQYGLDPNDPGDRDLDPDSDGLSNYEEYLRGTDPLVANNFPWNLYLPSIINSNHSFRP